MAFDQNTRGRLQKLVNACRALLSEDFSIQLQQVYGLDPKTGEVTPMARLTHLDDRQRHTAQVLRQVLGHYLGADADDIEHRIAVIDRMVREQAFTVLNRMAALLMMEARGQLFESVSKAYQSRGFQSYARLAGTALGETGQAYQAYLFSLFDELAQELQGLFDRFAANGLLFPRETALRALLDELNHPDITPLWAEDETIGWIYQYFNSKEERKAMREASQAPRNSRELAVRNQFFTPRYVVEFLVDNTLGRLWFNATGGATGLRDRCQYLLVKPDEKPEAAAKLRDPRTLKLLDPACGSMHFGLYAFNLFAEIYAEAWAWERQNGAGSLDVSTQPQAALKPLSHTYEDEESFLRDVPRLIIEHNIYGVDIDPRAAQIASLALWLRAQRAWHDAGVKAKDRPLIGRGHVVAAIAPPAERELRQQFAANLDQRDAELFEKTLQLLKGLPELGVLLQVERELPSLTRQVYVGKGTGLFAQQEQENWQQAEERLRTALNEFAQAAKSTYQGRLFAQDALQGLRLIDLCREVFDVVVMNPPFGLPAAATKSHLTSAYPDTWKDIYAAFIERALQLLNSNGMLGAITPSMWQYSRQLKDLRQSLINLGSPRLLVEVGNGVMDDAAVEASIWTASKNRNDDELWSLDLLKHPREHRAELMRDPGASWIKHRAEDCRRVAEAPYCHHVPKNLLALWKRTGRLENVARIAKGNTTFDDFRFLRLWYEVPAGSMD
jgi:type I restriction-modification system DNA methylase subunit